MRTPRAAVAGLAALLLACGCAAAGHPGDQRSRTAPSPVGPSPVGPSPVAPSPAAPSPVALDNCFTAARGTVTTVPDAGGGRLTLGIAGSGPRVVILANESDENLCSWLPFAARLAAAGYRAVLFDYGGNPPASEVATVVRRLRAAGGTRIVLMGASEGAKASLIAAARLGPAVQGVVSLSAEAVLYPGITVVGFVRHLRCPLLLVTAKQDPYGSAQAARQFLAAAPGRGASLVAVPGADHGTALLSGRSGRTARPAVLAFLHRVLT
jgi:pimeloyl-ACP methyl ester carboxylesterase